MNEYRSTNASASSTDAPLLLSVGIMARNEANTIKETIDSLFAQSVFNEIKNIGGRMEIICVVNGSSDETDQTVSALFDEALRTHPQRKHFTACVQTIAESGKPNASNQFIHTYSAKEARYLVLMDADIIFIHESAIWNLFMGLEENSLAVVTVGEPTKSLSHKRRLSPRESLSAATSRMTQSAPAQLTGQLYCIRTAAARHIRFPRALTSCDDGYVKNLVCTNFGRTGLQNFRILSVPNASHTFDAYLPLNQVLKNQKRQMMGQAFLHILIDQFIPSLDPSERNDLERIIRELEETRPPWLNELMTQHLHRTRYFWRLFPGFLTFRFQRLRAFPLGKRIILLPATLVGFIVTLFAGWMAVGALRKGQSQYWPELRSKKSYTGIHATPSR